MHIAHKFYDCTPQIVRAGRESVITIRPLFDHCRFDDSETYQIALIPTADAGGQTGPVECPRKPVVPSDGLLAIPLAFDGEQEYILLLERVVDGQPSVQAEFRLYALDDDLFARRPYKGDTHMHTYRSDGKESPAFVAASCRKIGLDFMAITDHRQYAPSLEAIRAFEDVDTDLRIYPGEEVHPPNNPVHIVNFGGSFSVNELFQSEAYASEAAALEGELTQVPAGVDRYSLASCIWCFRKIRQAGGLGVFCHPYWLYRHRFDVPEYLTDLLFDAQPFDALELIGGFHLYEAESNMLQVARYNEERANGKRIPIVGASDSHGCEQAELFGWYYTVVFAKSLDLPDIINGVRELYSVAVEGLPNEQVRAFGPFRLVKYAQFLIREVFPRHDELCVEEGRLMLAHVAGDPSAAAALSALKSRTAKLYDLLWSRS